VGAADAFALLLKAIAASPTSEEIVAIAPENSKNIIVFTILKREFFIRCIIKTRKICKLLQVLIAA